MHLDCLLRLNLANQSRIEFFRNRIEIKLAKAKERKMILEGRLNMPSSNRKRKYEKPVLLHHFKNGYFCDGLGHIPVEVADAGCTKLSALKLGCLRLMRKPNFWTRKVLERVQYNVSANNRKRTFGPVSCFESGPKVHIRTIWKWTGTAFWVAIMKKEIEPFSQNLWSRAKLQFWSTFKLFECALFLIQKLDFRVKIIATLFQAISSRRIGTTKEMDEKRRKGFMGRCYAM